MALIWTDIGETGPGGARSAKRLGHFILAEDDETLEGVVLHISQCDRVSRGGRDLYQWTDRSRLAPAGGRGSLPAWHCGPEPGRVSTAVGLAAPPPRDADPGDSGAVATAARHQAGVTHALAVLVDLDEGDDRIDFGGTICLAIATAHEVVSRRSRIVGGREWVRLGAVEMGLDCLRRYLQGLPVHERIDFEKTDDKP